MPTRDKKNSWKPKNLSNVFTKPFLLFSLALFATLAASWVLHTNLKAKAEERFERHVAVTYQALEERINTYLAMLRATSGLFALDGDVTLEEFKAYANQLRLDTVYPGVQGIGYSAYVSSDQAKAFEQKMRGQGHENFRIWPETSDDSSHTIAFLEPMDERNRAAIGFNMFSEATRREAMERARDTGEPAASGKVTLVQEIDEDIQAGFLIYLPLYKTVTTLNTVEARRQNLQGFVYSPFRVGDLLSNIFGTQRPNVEFSVYDGDQIEANSLMFQSDLSGTSGEGDTLPVFTATETLNIAGRTWTITFISGPDFNQNLNNEWVALLFAVGLIVSLLIAWLTFKEVSAREETAESERLFRHVFNFQFQFMAILSPEGRIREINELPLQIGSTDRETVIGKFFWETPWWAGLPHMQETWPGRLKEAAQADDPILSRDEFRAADGSVRIADAAVTAVKNEKGYVQFFIVQATDITERLNVERAHKLLSAIVESSDDAVISKNLESVILSWNEGAEKLFGYSEEEVIGKPITMIIPKGYRKEESQIIARLKHYERIDHFETKRLNKDGEILDVSVTISPLLDDYGNVIGASTVARDITARKKAETQVKEYTAKLEATNKKLTDTTRQLEQADRQKNEFLAILGHELRNPLAAISGGIQVLQIEKGQAEEMLDSLEKSVRLISSLLDDMLDLTRISRGNIQLNKKVFDLKEAINAAIANVEQAIEKKNQTLKVVLPEDPLWVNADPVRMEQIVINLLTNARKYTQEGGKIDLVAKDKEGKIVISVKDNGMGVEPDMLERIFQPFTRTARAIGSPGSLGIGLALVKQLTVQHGGSVKAYSKGEGKGAEFVIQLPLAALLSELVTLNNPVKASEELVKNTRVMLVDDNPDALVGTEMILKQKGCIVEKAFNAEQAIEAAKTFKADVFLLDIGMPGMNGYELSQYLRDSGFEDALIIAVSGFGHEDAHRMSKEAGIDYHMNKPLDYQALVQIMASHNSSDRAS